VDEGCQQPECDKWVVSGGRGDVWVSGGGRKKRVGKLINTQAGVFRSIDQQTSPNHADTTTLLLLLWLLTNPTGWCQ